MYHGYYKIKVINNSTNLYIILQWLLFYYNFIQLQDVTKANHYVHNFNSLNAKQTYLAKRKNSIHLP